MQLATSGSEGKLSDGKWGFNRRKYVTDGDAIDVDLQPPSSLIARYTRHFVAVTGLV
jgi:hypothetical protein